GEGLVAILPDSQSDRVEENFQALLQYLKAYAAELHINPDQVAIWACSGNVGKSFGLAENPKYLEIKSAVMYYGAGPVSQWRIDLPVMYVRAGLDRPGMNEAIDELSAAAIKANAPIELVNYPGGHHGFDVFDNNDASRQVIASTLRFLKTTLDSKYQAAMAVGRAEAEAAGAVSRGDF